MYSVVEIPSVSAAGYTEAWGLSPDGHVVGTDFAVAGPGSTLTAFVSFQGVTQDLNIEDALSSAVTINASGAIGGWYIDPNAPYETPVRTFLLTSAEASPTFLHPLLPAEALESYMGDLNDSLEVVGGYLAPPSATEYWDHAYLYKAASGEMVPLDQLGHGILSALDINNAHQIVGKTTSGGYLYDASSDSFEALTFRPHALNDSGVVVGKINDATAVVRSASGTVQTLPGFGGDYFVVTYVNNHGTMVGYGTFDSGPHGQGDFHAFLSEGGPPVNLNDQLASGSTDWHLDGAVAINDSGQILARGRRPTDNVDRSVLLIPQPKKLDLPFLAIYAAIFGGVASDGGGWGFYGGRFHKIPPYDPGPGFAQRISQAERDVLSGLLVGEVAGTLQDEAARRELRAFASRIVTQAGARLYTEAGAGAGAGAKASRSARVGSRAQFLDAMSRRTGPKKRG